VAIASFEAGSPAARQHLFDRLASLADLATLEGIFARHEARILDHESHKLGRIATDGKELESGILDKTLKSRVCRDTHTVTICIAKDLSQRNKRLHIASRADNLDNHVETGWRCLTGEAAKAWWDIGWWQWLGLRSDCRLMKDGISQGARLCVDGNINTAIFCGLSASLDGILIEGQLIWELSVGWRKLVVFILIVIGAVLGLGSTSCRLTRRGQLPRWNWTPADRLICHDCCKPSGMVLLRREWVYK